MSPRVAPSLDPAVQPQQTRRRSSIDMFVQSDPNEAKTSTVQLDFAGDGYVPTGEVVPAGCLSKETSDILVNIMLGEKHPLHSTAQSMAALALVVIVPPLLGGLLYGVVPLKDPSIGFVGSRLVEVLVMATTLWGPGLTAALCVALKVPTNLPKVIAFTLAYSLAILLTLFVLGEIWMFPVPMGVFFGPCVGFSVACTILFYMIFGKKIFADWALIKRLLPLFGVALLPIVFVVVFVFYRAAFIQMGPGQQALFGPVWPLLKLGFKKVGTLLVDAGGNPDAAPYLLWVLDACCAMCGNFLFISASNISSVFTMISVDVVENLFLALRLVFKIQRSRNATQERLTREKDAKLAKIEARLEREVGHVKARLEREVGHVKARLARLENVVVEVPDADTEDTEASESQRLLDNDDDGREAAIGEEQLHLHRACRLLLNFMASEMSEMICSGWCMIMLPILYYSSNKKYFYTIDELDDAGFKQALIFSAVDFVLEAVTFAAMLVVFALQANINVIAVGVEYVRRKDLFLPILGMGVALTIATFAFFVKHFGMDPEFKWDQFQRNATAL
ncbi:hypothetical protein TrCOL_g9466 [Triparma columacea]|uniref:Uncharacterized protein n=1 Tax=Triparma columacea TaxID=722753 RepID=A0A9W7FYA4_9STRA|nr:hypothetical protein TrCOL_g9466 [Triparma columacea]